MSIQRISATEASRSLSTILNKVHYQGESYEIKRGKEIIARIIPATSKKIVLKVRELNSLFRHLPKFESEDQQAFENDINQIRVDTKAEPNPWD